MYRLAFCTDTMSPSRGKHMISLSYTAAFVNLGIAGSLFGPCLLQLAHNTCSTLMQVGYPHERVVLPFACYSVHPTSRGRGVLACLFHESGCLGRPRVDSLASAHNEGLFDIFLSMSHFSIF